jgi:Fic family protein
MPTALTNVIQQADTLKQRLHNLRPLDPEAVSKIKASFEMEYTFESNRIEGNTLTLQETALIVNEGLTIGGKSIREHLEAINHAQAIEFIKETANKEADITEWTVKEIHALILYGMNRKQAGQYRNAPVRIVGSRHIPPQPYLIASQMENFITRYKTMEQAGTHPILTAAYLHDELVKIHPFIDGNGRTSRLLMNLYLLSKGYTLTALKGDPQAKQAYYTALETSHVDGNGETFQLLVAHAVKNALENYLRIVEE